jgi:hypothetical protein
MPPHHDNVLGLVIAAIIICLLAIAFILWYIYRSNHWFVAHSDHVRAGVITPDNVHLFVDGGQDVRGRTPSYPQPAYYSVVPSYGGYS